MGNLILYFHGKSFPDTIEIGKKKHFDGLTNFDQVQLMRSEYLLKDPLPNSATWLDWARLRLPGGGAGHGFYWSKSYIKVYFMSRYPL